MEKNRKRYTLGSCQRLPKRGDLVEGDSNVCGEGKREGERESKRKKRGH